MLTPMNHVIEGLDADTRRRLAPVATRFARGVRLLARGERPAAVHFPVTAVVSAVVPLADGGLREVAMIGCEGATGAESSLQESPSTMQLIVPVGGEAWSVDVRRWRETLAESAPLRERIDAFRNAFLAQVMQSAACNATHSAEERLARWLLTGLDRTPTAAVSVTHEFLADMLGVTRPRVTLLAQTFQAAGLIRYARGIVTVVDREGLAGVSCECYATVRRVYEALLPYKPDCADGTPAGPGRSEGSSAMASASVL